MIWLIGDKGMLGTEVANLLTHEGLAWSGSDRETDIRDPDALRAWLVASVGAHAGAPAGGDGRKLDWIINCSAYTAVDKAEGEEELARGINATGAGNIARIATEAGARLIHISTDYVFRGDQTRPYLESDPVDPQCAYGRTKAEGEALVSNLCPRNFILRTAWLYGQHGPNFVSTMLRLMRERDSIGVVADQRGTPTWAFDLAKAIVTIIKREPAGYGIYHYTNAGQTTWYEFAREIQRLGHEYGLLDHDCRINPLTTAEYPTKALRPAYSVLSKDKIIGAGIGVPEWKASLRAHFERDLTLRSRNLGTEVQ